MCNCFISYTRYATDWTFSPQTNHNQSYDYFFCSFSKLSMKRFFFLFLFFSSCILLFFNNSVATYFFFISSLSKYIGTSQGYALFLVHNLSPIEPLLPLHLCKNSLSLSALGCCAPHIVIRLLVFWSNSSGSIFVQLMIPIHILQCSRIDGRNNIPSI